MVVDEVGARRRSTCRTRYSPSRGRTRRRALLVAASWALLGSLPWAAGACATTMVMAELEGGSPEQPHSTILYSGVRDATRRFPDYSVVGRAILEVRPR